MLADRIRAAARAGQAIALYADGDAATSSGGFNDTYTLGNIVAGHYGVFVIGRGNTSGPVTDVTVDGQACSFTSVEVNNNDNDFIELWITDAPIIPSGSTGNVTINYTGTANSAGFVMFQLTGLGSTTPTDSYGGGSDKDATSPTGAMDVPARGVAICGAVMSTPTVTYSNLDEDVTPIAVSTDDICAASREFASAQSAITVGADGDSGADHLSLTAAFGP